MPLLPVLGVVFITLKLMGYIAWSWWLVLLPIYGSAVIVVLLVLLSVFKVTGARYGYRR